MVLFEEVVINLYMVVTVGFFFRNVFISLYVTISPNETINHIEHGLGKLE